MTDDPHPLTQATINRLQQDDASDADRRALLFALGHTPDCVAPDHYRKVWQAERDRLLAQGAMVEVIAEERDRLKVALADERRSRWNKERVGEIRRHLVIHLREDRDRWQAEAQRACEIAEDAVERADNAQRVPDEHEEAYWKSAAAHAYDEITKLSLRAERAERALRLAPAYACEQIPEKVAFTELPPPCGECDVCLFHAARDEALAEAPTVDPPAAGSEPGVVEVCPRCGVQIHGWRRWGMGGRVCEDCESAGFADAGDVSAYVADSSDPTRLAPEPNMCGWCGHFHTGRCLPYREAHGDRRPQYSRSGMDVIVPNVEDGGVLGDLVTCGQCGGSGELHDPHEPPEPAEPQDGGDFASPRHPHEPDIPRALDDEGRCRVCRVMVEYTSEHNRAEAAEWELRGVNDSLTASRDRIAELETELGEVRANNEALRAEVDEAHVKRIAAENPGIDIDRVRAERQQKPSKPAGKHPGSQRFRDAMAYIGELEQTIGDLLYAEPHLLGANCPHCGGDQCYKDEAGGVLGVVRCTTTGRAVLATPEGAQRLHDRAAAILAGKVSGRADEGEARE